MGVSLREKFARTLKSVRHQSGFSQAETAERTGIAVEAYGRLERGAVLPRAETLVRLAQTFGVSCDQLLGMSPVGTNGGAEPPRVDAELRRVVNQLDRLSPQTLHLIGSALRSIRRDFEAKAGK